MAIDQDGGFSGILTGMFRGRSRVSLLSGITKDITIREKSVGILWIGEDLLTLQTQRKGNAVRIGNSTRCCKGQSLRSFSRNLTAKPRRDIPVRIKRCVRQCRTLTTQYVMTMLHTKSL